MRRLGNRSIAILLALAIGLCLLSACASSTQTEVTTVRIAVPYEERLFGINEDYYKSWLEEQSGLKIEFTFIPQSYTEEYLRILLSGKCWGMFSLRTSREMRQTNQSYLVQVSDRVIEAYRRHAGGNLAPRLYHRHL